MVYGLSIDPTTFPPARISSISTLVNVFLPLLVTGAAFLFLVMAFYGAFLYLTNGDKPEILKKAQAIIIYAFVGLLIVVSSFVLVNIISRILGVSRSI
ncbi:MAG: hypothetical protein NZL96_01570 [Patescibacteria group bacterium]|nr:hypothetical protein [Patescibacteria group bacterium]